MDKERCFLVFEKKHLPLSENFKEVELKLSSNGKLLDIDSINIFFSSFCEFLKDDD